VKGYSRALIIDDDHDLCMLLKAMLGGYIRDVGYAHSIQNCKEMLVSARPDIIFIDNNLPDGQGVSYIKELKAAMPDVRIVMISAMAGLKKQAIEYGADVFIEKPLTQANVQKALEAQ
jgi:response regulator of citrate/malate metabolism